MRLPWRRLAIAAAVVGAFLLMFPLSAGGPQALAPPVPSGTPCPQISGADTVRTYAIGPGPSPAAPCPGNEIAYRDGGNLVIMNADGSGKSVVYTTDHPSFCCFSWSPDGKSLAFVDGASVVRIDLALVAGRFEASNRVVLAATEQATRPAWSPLGHEIAVTLDPYASTAIGVMPAMGGGMQGLYVPPDGAKVDFPSWRSDGTRIAFAEADATGAKSIKVIDRLTLEIVTSLPVQATAIMWLDWARTKDVVAFSDATEKFPGKGQDVFTVDLTTGTVSLVATEARVPSWSSDDTKLVFAKNFSYKRSVLVVDLTTGATKTLAKSGDFPSWSRA